MMKKKAAAKKAPARRSAVKIVKVKTERKAMTEADLIACFKASEKHPIVKGVFEIIDQLDEQIDRAHCDISVPREARGDAMLQKAMLIEVKERILSYSEMAKQQQ